MTGRARSKDSLPAASSSMTCANRRTVALLGFAIGDFDAMVISYADLFRVGDLSASFVYIHYRMISLVPSSYLRDGFEFSLPVLFLALELTFSIRLCYFRANFSVNSKNFSTSGML